MLAQVLFVSAVVVSGACLVVRFVALVRSTHDAPSRRFLKTSTCHTLVLLGSGGHTGEMLRLLDNVAFATYTPRCYVVSSGDRLSLDKALQLESRKATGAFTTLSIPRARRVQQSFWTAIVSTLYSFLVCFWHISLSPVLSSYFGNGERHPVDLVLLNGPGTCIPIVISIWITRVLFLPSPVIVYVESFARVKSLSLTGKLIRPLVDKFVVQWPELQQSLQGDELGVLRRYGLVGEVHCHMFVL